MKNKIRHFSTEQKEYIWLCLALDLEIQEIVTFFQIMFPRFGQGLVPDELRYKLARRISDIKRKNVDDIAMCRQKANDCVEYACKAIPISHRSVRLRYLQEIWDDTPMKSLVRVSKDSDGKKIEVYKSNVRLLLSILKELRKEVGAGRYVSVDADGSEIEISQEEAYLQMRESLDDFACTLSIDEDSNFYEVALG